MVTVIAVCRIPSECKVSDTWPSEIFYIQLTYFGISNLGIFLLFDINGIDGNYYLIQHQKTIDIVFCC